MYIYICIYVYIYVYIYNALTFMDDLIPILLKPLIGFSIARFD